MWGISTSQSTPARLVVVAACFAIVGVLTVESMRYVDRKRSAKMTPPTGVTASGLGFGAEATVTRPGVATGITPSNEHPPQPQPSEKTVAAKPKSHIQTVPPSRPYDLAGERRVEFLKLLKPPIGADTLRVACIAWSERACVAAGQFVVLFSEAGWTIEENRVLRLEPHIPKDGVFIVSQPEPGPPLPPHLGRWHAMNLSEITLFLAFTQMGFAPNGSTDGSLGKGVTGVYFGPEPAALKVDKQRVLAIQLMKFIYEGTAIEQQFGASNDAEAESREENEWTIRVEDWLRANLRESAAVKFRNTRGVEGRKKCLSAFVERLSQPKQQ